MKFERKSIRLYLLILSLLGWFALIAQYYLIFANRTVSIPETIIRYFSFFTILTNIIVSSCASVLALKRNGSWYSFFSKQQTLAAITVYIIVVSLVYNMTLRPLWHPTGLQKIVDELLHTVVPLMFVFFWLFYVPKDKLKFSNVLSWQVFPAVYAVAILFRGSFSGFYPYPFINYATLGFQQVATNIVLLIVVFVVFSLVIICIGRLMNRSQPQKNISETY
jgi:hypothetical protein